MPAPWPILLHVVLASFVLCLPPRAAMADKLDDDKQISMDVFNPNGARYPLAHIDTRSRIDDEDQYCISWSCEDIGIVGRSGELFENLPLDVLMVRKARDEMDSDVSWTVGMAKCGEQFHCPNPALVTAIMQTSFDRLASSNSRTPNSKKENVPLLGWLFGRKRVVNFAFMLRLPRKTNWLALEQMASWENDQEIQMLPLNNPEGFYCGNPLYKEYRLVASGDWFSIKK